MMHGTDTYTIFKVMIFREVDFVSNLSAKATASDLLGEGSEIDA